MTRRARHIATLAIVVAAAVTASVTAAGAGPNGSPQSGRTLSVAKVVPKQFGPKQGTHVTISRSKVKIERRPPAARFKKANPFKELVVTGVVKKTPFKPTPDIADFARKVIPRSAKPLPKLTQRKPSAAGRGAAGTDLVLFRNQEIFTSALSGTTGEPSVGNDRNSILFTGNWYTAFSSNNGISWDSLDPDGLDDANGSGAVSSSEQTDGGFCCDQVVNASDEDDDELVAWLLQYSDDGNENTVRVATFDGRSDLLAQTSADSSSTPITPCFYDFQPEDFDLGDDIQFDFNTMENTDEHLYVATNVFTIPKSGEKAKSKGSVVWRMSLDDLTDGNCRLDEGGLYFYDSNDQAPRLVNGAGSSMYWATQADTHLTLKIYKWPDGSDDVTQTNKGTALYHGGTFKCEKGSRNPCGFADTRITAGWTGDGEVGWLWSAAQAGAYKFPYVQGARFKTSDLSLIDEPVIWSDDFAWMYPSAGVNARGDVGVILYRLGGSENPRPRAFVVDDVSGWSSISTVGIATSSASPSDDRWGDYGRVAAYDGCSNTWIGSAYTASSSTTQKPTFVWFGRERDGCSDLVVSAFGFLYNSGSNLLTLADTTWNTGGVEAAPSKTRFYLSRDTDVDSRDKPLDVSHEVPSLDAADSDPELLFTAVPEGVVAGTYHVIACADQPESIDEVSDSNNCLADTDTLTVPLTVTRTVTPGTLTGVKRPGGKPGVKPGTLTGVRPTTTKPTRTIPPLTRTTRTLPPPTTTRLGPRTAPARTVPAPIRPTRPGTPTVAGQTPGGTATTQR